MKYKSQVVISNPESPFDIKLYSWLDNLVSLYFLLDITPHKNALERLEIRDCSFTESEPDHFSNRNCIVTP